MIVRLGLHLISDRLLRGLHQGVHLDLRECLSLNRHLTHMHLAWGILIGIRLCLDNELVLRYLPSSWVKVLLCRQVLEVPGAKLELGEVDEDLLEGGTSQSEICDLSLIL